MVVQLVVLRVIQLSVRVASTGRYISVNDDKEVREESSGLAPCWL